MKFSWDPDKEKINRRKHKVAFFDACHVFADKCLLTVYDETFENLPSFVIPAKAGIHKTLKGLDSCFRRNDDLLGFGRNSKVS